MLPVSTKKTAVKDAKLIAWKDKILLNLIIPAKIRIEFTKFKTTAKAFKFENLPTIKNSIWRAEIMKNRPKRELG